MPTSVIESLRAEFEAKSLQFEHEIEELRRMIAEGQISVDRAHARIDQLERSLAALREEIRKLATDLKAVGETVSTFSPKLDKFIDNLWKAFFMLLVIVAALVGIKLL